MKYYNDMHDLIGKTPLVKLNHVLNLPVSVNVFAKLEYYNPSGSVKDRTGLYMVNDAFESGVLKEGYTIIEATAGNTGLGVAFAALNRNVNGIFVVPEKFSIEKQVLMKALGATIIHTKREDGMLGAAKKAQELLKTVENSVSLEQFKNMSNPRAHYETTGVEIYDDLDGNIDYLVAGAGSGGTYSGVVKYLKERNPDI